MDTGRKVVELSIDDVLPNRFQPRIKFNEEAIVELSKSIKEHGVIQPIVVRRIGDKYEIIAGERRYKASCMAGLKTIPAIITDLNDKDSAEVALIENVQRENLTPIEEAISYKKILDMGYITQEALATKLGKTQSTVANKLRLLNLDDEAQEALLNEKISERHARSLLKISDKEQQRQMLNRIIEERLTVRRADEEIEKIINPNSELETPVPNETSEFKFINQQVNEEPKNKFFNITNNNNSNNKPEELNQAQTFNILSDDNNESTSSMNIFNSPFNLPTPNHNAMLEELNEIEKSINNSNKKIEEEIEAIDDFDDDQEFVLENNSTNQIELEKEETQEYPNKEENLEINNQQEKIELNEHEIQQKEESINSNNRFITVDPNIKPIKNFKDVLSAIRNCSTEIENAGFVIDTEEYDLEDTYQVIFKITKDK